MREIIIFKVGWLLDSAQPLVRTKYATMLLSMHERVSQFVHVKRYTTYFDGLQNRKLETTQQNVIYSAQKYMPNLREVIIKTSEIICIMIGRLLLLEYFHWFKKSSKPYIPFAILDINYHETQT